MGATDPTTLLPPNATAQERAVSTAGVRVSDVPTPLSELWNPATCPIDLLPWLAWALSTDRWRVEWSEAQKRAEVAIAIEQQRRKGTPASIETMLASFDELLELTEWFEMDPPGVPHTFEVRLPLNGAGGTRSTAAFAREIVRDINRLKPVRSHLTFLQTLAGEGTATLTGAAQVLRFERRSATAEYPTPEGETYLLTELGEPIQDPDGTPLEDI